LVEYIERYSGRSDGVSEWRADRRNDGERRLYEVARGSECLFGYLGEVGESGTYGKVLEGEFGIGGRCPGLGGGGKGKF
jgi:hypothetical protein